MKFFLRYATKAAKPSECCAAGIPTTPDPSSPEAYISVKARQSGCAKIGLWVE